MSIPSNIYAEKVYGDHPTVLWSLDDQIEYVSAISGSSANPASWTAVDGTIEDVSSSTQYSKPITSGFLTKISGIEPVGLESQTAIFGPTIVDYTKHTISISTHAFIESIYISNIEIGISVDGGIVNYHSYPIGTEFEEWVFISKTFDLSSTTAKDIVPYVRITYQKSQSADSYAVTLNGFAIGYEIEEFSYSSLGISSFTNISGITSLGNNIFGVSADAYGLAEQPGYYLKKDSWALAARNSSIPMVYGASNSTVVSNNGNLPGLIVPAKGLLSEKGKGLTYTFEGWFRIHANHNPSYERILGPIASTDGIYVNKQFLVLSIGNKFGAHYVGEWSRPMLIQITYSPQEANLILNGEKVVTLSLDASDIDFGAYNELEDWIGIYVNGTVASIEVDCLAIYPYAVSETIAKRRFVFGQGVEYPQGINSAYAGQSMLVDYSVANYAKNYSYPDIGSWDQGIYDNVYLDSKAISAPKYDLPTLVSASYSSLEDFENTHTQNSEGFSFKLSGDKASNSGYFRLDSLPISSGIASVVYISVKRDLSGSGTQDIFSIINKNGLGKISVYTVNGYIKIDYKDPDGNTTSLGSASLSLENPYTSVAIDLNYLRSNSQNFDIVQMLMDHSGLQAIVAGSEDEDKTFIGEVIEFGLLSQRDASITTFAGITNGILIDDIDISSSVQPSYGLFLKKALGRAIIDIRVHGYWEDYLPVSYFAKTVYHDEQEQYPYRSVDFLQFNIDHENVYIFDGNSYDTAGLNVISSISFIDISQAGYSVSGEAEPTIVKMPTNGVVKATAGWSTKEYQVVDSAIIYPPTDIDLDLLGMVVKINMYIDGIRTTPVKIKNLHISSQALNDVLPNSTNTKFGVKLYPYTEDQNGQIDYKSENPFIISKNAAPYLHLGKKTGVASVGTHDINVDRGLAIKVNENGNSFFTIGTIQAVLRSNTQQFSQDPVNVFEIHTKTGTININAKAIDSTGERAYLYAEKDGIPFTDIVFFINGHRVGTPVITIHEWAIVGMAFTSLLEFGSFSGLIKFSGEIVINNLSYFQVAEYQKGYVLQNISWNLTKFSNSENPQTLQWSDASTKTWEDLYQVVKPAISGINPEDVYKIYLGANKVILNGSTAALTFKDYEYNLYRDITWQSKVVSVV